MGVCASKPRSADNNPHMQQEQVSTYTSELNLEEDDYLRKYSRSRRSLSALFKEEEQEEREYLLKQEIEEKDIIRQRKVSKPSVNAIVSKKQENSTTKIQPPVSEIQNDVLENVKLEASEASVQKPVEAPTKPESEVSKPSVNAVVSEKQENLTTEIQSLPCKVQNDVLGGNVKLEASEASVQEPVEARTKPKNDMVSEKQENSTTKIQFLPSQIQNAVLEDSAKPEASQAYVQKSTEAPTKPKSEVSKPSANAVVSEKQETLTAKIQSPPSEIQNDVLEDNVKLEASEALVQKPAEAPTEPKSEVSKPSVNAIVSEKQENLTAKIQSLPSEIQNVVIEDNIKIEASQAYGPKLGEAPTEPKSGVSKPSVNTSEKQANSATKIHSLPSEVQTVVIEEGVKLEASQVYAQKLVEALTKPKSEVSKPSGNGRVCEKQENSITQIESLSPEICNVAVEDSVKLEASQAYVLKQVEAPTNHSTCTVGSDISCTNEKTEVGTDLLKTIGEDSGLPTATTELQSVQHSGVDLVKNGSGVEGSTVDDRHGVHVKIVKHGIDTELGVPHSSLRNYEMNEDAKKSVNESGIKVPVVEAMKFCDNVKDQELGATKPAIGNYNIDAENSSKSEIKESIVHGNHPLNDVEYKDLGATISASRNCYVNDRPENTLECGIMAPIGARNHTMHDVKAEDLGVTILTSGNDVVDLAAGNSFQSGRRLQIDADHTSNSVEDRHLGTTKPAEGISDVGDSWENSLKSEINLPMVDGSENKDLGATGLAGEKYVVDNDAKDSFNPGLKVPSVGLNHSFNDIEDKNVGKASSRTEDIDLITVEDPHGNSLTVKTQQLLESEKALGIDPMSSITSVSVPASSDVAASASSGKELEEGLKTEGLGRMKWAGEGEMRAESRELEVVDAQVKEQAVHQQALVPDHLVTEVGTEKRDLHHNANRDNESLGNNIDYSSKIHGEKLSQKDQSLVIESAVEKSCATTSTNFTEEPEEYNTEVPIMERVKGAPDNSVYAK